MESITTDTLVNFNPQKLFDQLARIENAREDAEVEVTYTLEKIKKDKAEK